MYQVPKDKSAPVGTLGLGGGGIAVTAQADGGGELRLERWQRAQPAREAEIKEGPELPEVVLDGCAREDEAMDGGELLGTDGDL